MSAPSQHKVRAYLVFLATLVYYFLASSVAHRAAPGWVSDGRVPLVEQLTLAILLLAGFSLIGRWVDAQSHTLAKQGFPLREGWLSEVRLGTALGWAIAIVCVLPLTVIGGIAVRFHFELAAWIWWFADLLFFAAAALVEEVAFRGYGFQSLERAVGSTGAVIVYSLFFTVLQATQTGSSLASVAVSLVLSVLLSIAYLRTRALWLSWGLNFAWHASRAVLFGLVVAGVSSHSSVVQGDPLGPWWLTGDGFGLDGSWLAFLVLLAVIPLVYSLTRDLDFQYNVPVIVPGGIPVDLDAAARRQHEAAMGPETPAEPQLVQIAGAQQSVDSASDSPVKSGETAQSSDPSAS